jgi:hypothetical protein
VELIEVYTLWHVNRYNDTRKLVGIYSDPSFAMEYVRQNLVSTEVTHWTSGDEYSWRKINYELGRYQIDPSLNKEVSGEVERAE